MKKFLVLAALALMTVGFATQACAGRKIVRQDIGWKAPNVSLPGGAFNYNVHQPLASEALDTTAFFTLRNASILGPGGIGADDLEAQDSILVGYILAYTDSTNDPANTLTAATATLEASGDGNDWALVSAIACIAASDDPAVAFPLAYVGLAQRNLLLGAPLLRVRFASVTGIMTACRLKLVYWVDDDVEKVEQSVPWATWRDADNDGIVAVETTTSTQPFATEVLDTSGVFSLQDARLLGAGGNSDNFGAQDSVLIGFAVFYSDSAADVTNTCTAATITFDGSMDGRDWFVCATGSTIAVSDDPVIVIPIIARPGLDHQMLLPLVNMLRCRVTTATGIITASRMRVIYWKDKS